MKKQKNFTWSVSLLLFLGMYLPTSINGNSSNALVIMTALVTALFYFYYIVRKGDIPIINLWGIALIIITLFLATLTTELDNFSLSVGLFYFLAGLLYCVDLKSIKVTKGIEKVFFLFNCINMIIGLGIVFMEPVLSEFVLKHYSFFFDDLVPWMLREGKPVLTFATHSIAGFYIHLFFYLCLTTYLVNKKVVFLLFSLIYLFFTLSLQSTTGYVFFFISVFLFLFKMIEAKKMGVLLFMFLTSLVILVSNTFGIKENLLENYESYKIVKATGQIGFGARYSESGVLANNFDYIANHPFSPIGMAYGEGLWLSDSGFLVTWIRGSLILFLSIYLLFYFFIKKQVMSKRSGIYLFFTFMLFEIGYPILTYQRTFFLLPFAIIYLNYLFKIKQTRAH